MPPKPKTKLLPCPACGKCNKEFDEGELDENGECNDCNGYNDTERDMRASWETAGGKNRLNCTNCGERIDAIKDKRLCDECEDELDSPLEKALDKADRAYQSWKDGER